jgi:hypothetical protein
MTFGEKHHYYPAQFLCTWCVWMRSVVQNIDVFLQNGNVDDKIHTVIRPNMSIISCETDVWNNIVSFPSLNRSSGLTTAIFQMLLIARSLSKFRELQLVTCHLVQVFETCTWKGHWKNWPQIFLPFWSYFGIVSQRLFIITESKNCLFPYSGKSMFSIEWFNITDIIVFSVNGNSALRK